MFKIPRVLCTAISVFVIGTLVPHSDRTIAQTATFPEGAAPHFRADGPDADAFGRKEGYPSCNGLEYIDDTRCRVGALSHFDALFPARTIAAPKQATPLARAATEPVFRYTSAGDRKSVV